MKFKRRFLVLLLSCLFLFASNVYAEYFDITKYHVDIKVNLDNSYDIVEEITADFIARRHGIIRKIQYNSNMKRIDGTEDSIV